MKRSPIKRKATKESLIAFRKEVIRRARGRCQRCRQPFQDHLLDAHHMIPRGRGGTDDPDNGRALCRICHTMVHDHTADDWRNWKSSLPSGPGAAHEPAGAISPQEHRHEDEYDF